MPTFHHLARHIHTYGVKHSTLFIVASLVMFWAVFDGIATFAAPLVITEAGFSKTEVGLIIGTSAIAGALIDFILCSVIRTVSFRRIFLAMIVVSALHPLVLKSATTLPMFILMAVIWGLYYDLKGFGVFNYVGRYVKEDEHSSSFGVIQVFQSLGYLFAPIIAGLVIGDTVGWQTFIVAWAFLGAAFLSYLSLSARTLQQPQVEENPSLKKSRLSLVREAHMWKVLGRYIYPILILTMTLNIIDAFFWTVGPLYAESLTEAHSFAGFFMTAYSLPALVVGWFAGSVTSRVGKRGTAYTALLIGSLLLTLIAPLSLPIAIFGLVFVASLSISLAWPAINGVYADYISKREQFEKEIEGLEDFFGNLGYVIGPMLAGFMADLLGNSGAFSFLGVLGAAVAYFLLQTGTRQTQLPEEVV